MKRFALFGLAAALLACASVSAADSSSVGGPSVTHATPLLDVPQETVVGCLTITKEEKRVLRKKSTLVSSQCFQGLVSNEKDQLPQSVIDAQTIRTEQRREVSYVQSTSHTQSQLVTFAERPDAVASSALDIQPAVSKDIVTVIPGVVSEGVNTALRFNRKASGELDGNLKLSIEKIDAIRAMAPSDSSTAPIQLPQRSSVDFEGSFTQPFAALRHGPYVISLDFKVLPIGQNASFEDLKAVEAP